MALCSQRSQLSRLSTCYVPFKPCTLRCCCGMQPRESAHITSIVV